MTSQPKKKLVIKKETIRLAVAPENAQPVDVAARSFCICRTTTR
jgi:hypothetical protein